MLRILSLVLVIVVFIGGVVLIVGYNTLPSYSTFTSFEVSYSPDLVWEELVSINEIPQRKNDVVSVEVLEEFGKLVAWQENLKNGGYRIYRMNERQEKEKLVIELTSSSYGLTGIWTFEIKQRGAETQIAISEKSTLTDVKIRGYRALVERDHDLLVWIKYIRVGLIQALLISP